MSVIIYALIDPRTQQPRYVGLTRNLQKRVYQHLRVGTGNLHLRRWILLLHRLNLNLEVIILETVQDIDADMAECRWIADFKDLGFPLLNLTDGGERAYTVSDETRQRLSENKSAYYKSPNHKPSHFSFLNKSRIGIPLSTEHKRKVSESLKGKPQNHSIQERLAAAERFRKMWQNPDYRKRVMPACLEILRNGRERLKKFGSPLKGTTLAVEHRRKVSEAVRRAQTPEYREKLSAAMKLHSKRPEMTPERRAKIAEKLRRYYAEHSERRAQISRQVRTSNLPRDWHGRYQKVAIDGRGTIQESR